MSTIINETVVQAGEKRAPAISWGAVFAGLLLVIATAMLLVLLGSSIGMSVADASDMEAVGEGFGVTAAIWMAITFVAAYFMGGLITGRLAGNPDNAVGMLHGVTLWGLASVVSVWLAASGVAGIAQMGYSAVQGVAQTATSAASAVSAASSMDMHTRSITNSPIYNRVAATVRRNARASLANTIASTSSELTAGEAKQVIREIDNDTLQTVALRLVEGDTEGAKDAVAANTTLSDEEINTVIDGAAAETQRQIDEAQQALAQATEAASTYATSTLWALFIATALALIASIAGGWVGAGTVKRLYYTDTAHVASA